jgi:hypothetical protein
MKEEDTMKENTNLVQVKEAAQVALSNEVVERHSLFQLQCFVLAKEPTIQGKLQQCLREIKSRKASLDALELEIGEQEDQLQLIDLDVETINESVTPGCNNRDEQRKLIKLRSLERRRKSILASVKELKNKEKNISEEMMFFCSAFDQLSRREKPKPWDDVEVQKEYWSEKLRFEVNTRLLLHQLPDLELMKTILCLHDDSPIKQTTVKMLQDVNKQAAEARQVLPQNQVQKG